MRYLKILMAAVAICALVTIVIYLSKEPAPSEAVADGEGTPEVLEGATPHLPQEGEKEILPLPEDEDGHGIATKMREILLAADEFYDEANETTVITQQNGILYHGAANISVTPAYLITRDYLPSDYDLEGANILYMSSSDVVEVIPSFSERDSVFSLYVSAPYEGSFLIYSKGEVLERITAEQYNELLSSYTVDHGKITRITASSPEYNEINRLLKEYEQNESDFYIRYGMKNNKYAVIISSPKNNYSKITMYVFVNRDDKWEIKVPNLEAVDRAKTVVLNICHDFDLELMPKYDVKAAISYMDDKPSDITATLISSGYITEANVELEYISKGLKFLFAKYTNGQKFVGVDSGEMWVLSEVNSAENARNYFMEFDQSAPDLLIIWE